MKTITISIIFSLLSFHMQAQNLKPDPYENKYDDKDFNGLKVAQVMDGCGFKPIKRTTDIRQFKSVILQLSDRAYTQFNIDTWYLCSYKHEENFQIYNMYYKPITRNYYDENCKSLLVLMLIDGTIKQSK